MRRSRGSDEEEEEEEDIPLHHKRPFGSGLKRKKIEFVRATEPDETAVAASASRAKASAIGNLYASIVLGQSSASSSTPTPTPEGVGEEAAGGAIPQETSDQTICPVCLLPITTSISKHNASLAHQVSLEHSHPPSALDRSRMGLKALAAQGWNPDARQGLGKEGEGMRFPIKVSAKEDNLGIGATIPEMKEGEIKVVKEKPMSVKELKAIQAKEKTKTEKLQREIFGSVDVDKYLKKGAEWE
ncbi:unnamed protein product [Clonostachys rhizophaga]|uniref:G-patch domain-containing protein n=1 Tax=Clonostachys rhizophaga TaxID=160324 RepID=A0A9N9YGV6_9HYPO|nr:unnamed protein product [Clonostachys rhizophaga]